MEDIPAILGVMIPILVLMIPIVAILTRHQQKMAEIMAHGHAVEGGQEIYALRRELAEMRELMHQQAIAIDTLVSQRPPQTDLGERLRTGA